MLKVAFDENFNNDIVRGVLRRLPSVDAARVQDVGLSGADDPAVLEWAASEGRVLFTHDVATMAAFAADRTRAGLDMPGLFEAPATIALRTAIDDIVLIAECSLEGEWEGQVMFLPLR